MGLSTERKVFIGILCVAGSALLIDQVVLKPSSAQAMPVAIAGVSDLLITPTSAPAQAPVGSQLTMAQVLLDRLGEQSTPAKGRSLGSAFTLDQLISSSVPGADQPEPGGVRPPQPSLPVIAPAATDLPVLTSVMPSRSGGGAVLGGKLVQIGQETPAGFELIEVRERSVILRRDGRLYTLTIPVQVQP